MRQLHGALWKKTEVFEVAFREFLECNTGCEAPLGLPGNRQKNAYRSSVLWRLNGLYFALWLQRHLGLAFR